MDFLLFVFLWRCLCAFSLSLCAINNIEDGKDLFQDDTNSISIQLHIYGPTFSDNLSEIDGASRPRRADVAKK